MSLNSKFLGTLNRDVELLVVHPNQGISPTSLLGTLIRSLFRSSSRLKLALPTFKSPVQGTTVEALV